MFNIDDEVFYVGNNKFFQGLRAKIVYKTKYGSYKVTWSPSTKGTSYGMNSHYGVWLESEMTLAPLLHSHFEEYVPTFSGTGTVKGNKCECGKEKHGFAQHIYWCDLYA